MKIQHFCEATQTSSDIVAQTQTIWWFVMACKQVDLFGQQASALWSLTLTNNDQWNNYYFCRICSRFRFRLLLGFYLCERTHLNKILYARTRTHTETQVHLDMRLSTHIWNRKALDSGHLWISKSTWLRSLVSMGPGSDLLPFPSMLSV